MKKRQKPRLNLTSVKMALQTIHTLRKQYLPILFINAILQALKPFVPIVFSARILDELLGERNQTTLITLAALLVGFLFILHILSGYFTKRYNDETNHLIFNYEFELSKKTMKLDYALVEKTETMDLLQLIQEGGNNYMSIWHIAEFLQLGTLAILEILIASGLILTMFTSGSQVEVTGNLGFIQSPLMFVAMVVVLLTGIFLSSIIQGKLGETVANSAKGGVGANRIFGYLFFHISYNYANGKDIRLYNAQNLLHEKIMDFVTPNCDDCLENFVKPNIRHYSLLNLVNVFMMVAVYTFVVLKAYVGAITIGVIFIQVNAIMRLYQAIGSFLKQYNMLIAACDHFQSSITYFNLPEMKKEGSRQIEPQSNYVFEFKDVSFKYPSSETYALHHINLTINSGERLAVVGMNGSGKTTLIKLLCRLYEPTEGTITLNGIDIREYDYEAYIRLFSVVFQDFKLFSFGMDQNVAVSEDVDMEKLEDSLIHAGLETMVHTSVPDYQVSVGKNFDEEGRDFSGGEEQKLAIARALYKDAPIVVLDEPTAALDPIAEFEIYSKFDALVKDKAAVFISHRLSSCRFCHNIAVFDRGEIVQLGNHASLVSDKEGKYHELWFAQADHYVYE
ncbi:ABC transporter ATP-binding protein [Proteiniclasticum sp. SCR006]|uniref:ABC transporter ATP-binding protein n=1 Tax=Proteiniclasticum aestuarii TaxID=2817862 RepID=A0A939HBE2_9CLOT|nr:ABC transporter ATP-binding protein [Proteiniclasticum aestuarii]MBO1264847.1 ABC transporter ATP-binding protein [Proteiniclasticum aestuarii]